VVVGYHADHIIKQFVGGIGRTFIGTPLRFAYLALLLIISFLSEI
jgi:hypothetical protein